MVPPVAGTAIVGVVQFMAAGVALTAGVGVGLTGVGLAVGAELAPLEGFGVGVGAPAPAWIGATAFPPPLLLHAATSAPNAKHAVRVNRCGTAKLIRNSLCEREKRPTTWSP
jgi:hypothetical protein